MTTRRRTRKQTKVSENEELSELDTPIDTPGTIENSPDSTKVNEQHTTETRTNESTGNGVHVFKDVVPDENHLLEMRTLAGNTFRNLLDTLKAVLNDANIVFTEKGLKLAAVDTKRHALVHLFMDASSFQHYHCQQKLVLGVDIDSLHRTMKTNKSNDLMCFIYRKDNPGFLDVFFENTHKKTKVFDRLKLLSLKEYNIFDKIVYKVPVPEMDSQLLQSICREMSSFGATKLEIQKLGGKELVFRNLDGTTQRTVVIDIGDEYGQDSPAPEEKCEDARGVFLLKFLKSFAKAANLSPKVKIYLQNESPLICEYSISDHGTLKYVLSGEEDA